MHSVYDGTFGSCLSSFAKHACASHVVSLIVACLPLFPMLCTEAALGQPVTLGLYVRHLQGTERGSQPFALALLKPFVVTQGLLGTI